MAVRKWVLPVEYFGFGIPHDINVQPNCGRISAAFPAESGLFDRPIKTKTSADLAVEIADYELNRQKFIGIGGPLGELVAQYESVKAREKEQA